MEAHAATVESIARRARRLYNSQTPFRIYHGSTNSTRSSQRRPDNIVDTSKLNHVLHVDSVKKTVLVEPNVPMDALLSATLEHGLVPLVVMEFPGITVGGGFSGTSGESSSFRYGAFDSTVNRIEIVLPNGEIENASKTEKQDLFWGAASAFGTLGIVTLLEVQLRQAKAYIHLSYQYVPSIAKAVEKLQDAATKAKIEYLDAIMLSIDCTIICTGTLVDDVPPEASPRQFLRARDPWFFVHVERIAKRLEKKKKKNGAADPIAEDFIPLTDYLFRYDRGAFWTGRYAFRYFVTPFNRITRFLLNPFMHTRVMYRALHPSGLADFYMVQDVGVPFAKAEEFTLWLHESLEIYPLWLCPLRLRRDSPDAAHGLHADFAPVHHHQSGAGNTTTTTTTATTTTPESMLNFGIWGPASFDRRETVRLNRALERKLADLGGRKWLYAHAYYTEAEFWANYDRKSYEALRARYHAAHLPSVYDKVCVDVEAEEAAVKASWAAWFLAFFWSIWPLRGLYGVYITLLRSEYLLRGSEGVVRTAPGALRKNV